MCSNTLVASKIEVPEERYMDWDVETDSEGEDIEDEDFDMLDGDDTPRKPCAYTHSYLHLEPYPFYSAVKSQGKKPARPSPQKKTVSTWLFSLITLLM